MTERGSGTALGATVENLSLVDPVDRAEAIPLAFRLVHDIQAGATGSADLLLELAHRAQQLGWDEVERACLFGEVVQAWMGGDGDIAKSVATLIEQSEDANDRVMLALALALRSDEGLSGEDRAAVATRDEDLARAVVLLEQAGGRPCERISVHTACAIAFGNRWLFELAHEQYAIALEIGAGEPEGSVDFLLAPILFNIAEEQVSWASKLRQIGDDSGVQECWRVWQDAVVATRTYPMPDAWKDELEALGLLLATIAGHDSEAAARELLERITTTGAAPVRGVGLARLAIALSIADAGRPGAEDANEAALSALNATVHPFPYDLALFLSATLEARTTAGWGLRYARRAVEEQWAKRQAALGSMQVQIQSARLVSENELLSRHARLDDLTGVGNRRALGEYVAALQQRSIKNIALILFDVDAFKKINDSYSHLAGDAVLVRIARILERAIRSTDLVVRLGGDEFAVILADTDLDAAAVRAEKLINALNSLPLTDLGEGLELRVSAGLACGAPNEMIKVRAAADAALYEAKAAGGRCLRLSSDPVPVGRVAR